MSHLSEVRSDQRSSRVKLGGSILAVVLLENGRQVRAKMHQLSGNGGLLHLDKPLDESIKVEVVFHVGETSFRTPAEMLFPMWATKGCLQPFRFVELSEMERTQLSAELDSLL
jgi:hypothetical protein